MRTLVILNAAMALAASGAAQDASTWAGRTLSEHRVYVSPGLAVSGVGGGKGPEASVAATYEHADRFAVTVRYATAHDLDFDDLLTDWRVAPEARGSLGSVSSAGLVVSRVVSDGRAVTARLGIGPALAWGTRHTGAAPRGGVDPSEPFEGPAALATAEVTGRILPILGVGGHVTMLAGPDVQVGSAGWHFRVGLLW